MPCDGTIAAAGRRRTAGGAGAIVGVDGFSGSNYYAQASDVLKGSSGFSVAAIVRVDAVPGGTQALFSKGSAGTNGYQLAADASGFYFRVSGAMSPQRAIVAGDVGKWFAVVGVYDGSNVRLYVQGVEVGSGTPLGSYVPNTATPAFGRRQGSAGFDTAVDFAMASWGFHAADAKSGAEVSGMYSAAVSAGDLRDSDWQGRWSVADDGGGSPDPLTDQVGAVDMDGFGAMTAVSEATPTWGDP